MARTSPLVKEFLAYLNIERGLSENTVRSYANDLRLLQTWITSNQRQLRGLTTRDIELWIGSLNRRRFSPTSINRALSSTRALFQFLLLDGHVQSDPTGEIHSLKKTTYLPRFLSTEETQRLLNAADDKSPNGLRDRALLEILYGSGLRITEAVTLKIRDLSLPERRLICHGKGNKERQVPMSKTSVPAIQQYLQTRIPRPAPTASLFLHQQAPMTRQFAWTIIERYAFKARLKNVTPHTLRHSFATHLLEGGAPTKVVQLLLGHSHIQTTEIYTHVTPRHLRASYDKHHPRAHTAVSSTTEIQQ